MMVFIVPRVTESFSKTGTELPKLTQIIVAVSAFFTNDWLTLIIGMILVFITVKALNTTYAGRMFFAKVAINLPIF
jgi:type II secretory pathway component PulF